MKPEGAPSVTPRAAQKPNNQENPLINLAFNIVLPTVFLTKFSSPERLGPTMAFFVALSFPIAYGLYDLVVRKKRNFISLIGFISILLTGGLGLLSLEGFWFAVKEATIPGVIGVAILISQKTRYPLVKNLLYNDKVLYLDNIKKILQQRGTLAQLDRLALESTFLIAFSMLVSAVLNFALAIYFLKAAPGSSEFNEQLGTMTFVSYFVILLPCISILAFAMWRLVSQIKKLTDLDLESIFRVNQ